MGWDVEHTARFSRLHISSIPLRSSRDISMKCGKPGVLHSGVLHSGVLHRGVLHSGNCEKKPECGSEASGRVEGEARANE